MSTIETRHDYMMWLNAVVHEVHTSESRRQRIRCLESEFLRHDRRPILRWRGSGRVSGGLLIAAGAGETAEQGEKR